MTNKIFNVLNVIFMLAFSFIILSPAAFAVNESQTMNGAIAYAEKGKGIPLVLIHAFPTDKALWTPQLKELSNYFHVITIDLYGFGQSQTADGQAITMSRYAEEVQDLLNTLHIKKAIIGGESMGGYVALAFLKQYPDRVDGLILADTQTIADSTEAKLKRETTAVDVLANGSDKLINDFMPKALSPSASEQTRLFLRGILTRQSREAIASALRGMALREDTSDILRNTNLPVLIMTGDKDAVINQQQSQNMHALAKNSRLVVISNAGHLASLEQPDQWNKAVVDMFYLPVAH